METFKVYKRILSGGRNVDRKGEAKVYVEVIHITDEKRTTKRIDTTIRVKPKHWDKKRSEIKPQDEEFEVKNDIVDRKYRLVQNELESIKKGIQSDFKLVLFPEAQKGLIEFIDDYIEFRKSNGTPVGTTKEFTTCKNRIRAYEQSKDIKLKLDDCSLLFSDYFHSFLKSVGYTEGTIHKTFSILRTVLYYYFDRQQELNINVSDKFKAKNWKKGEPSENEPNALSRIQFSHLKDFDFGNTRLNEMRDRFLFQCVTGSRFSDAFQINSLNIKNGMINYQPVKTIHKRDNKVTVPINEISKAILEKYNWDMRTLAISNQKYNEGLKEMFEILIGKYPDIFDVRRTSHNGRDTFISFAIEAGVPVPTIMKWVGQSSYNQMKKYYESSNEAAIENMNLLKEFNL